MYCTILSFGVLLLSIILIILNGRFWFEEAVMFTCMTLIILTAVTSIICIAALVAKPCTEKDVLNDYVLCKEMINSPAVENVGVAYNVTKLTIDVNREIMRHNTYSKSKWTNWFYSEKVGQLPVLPLVSDPEDNVFENEDKE